MNSEIKSFLSFVKMTLLFLAGCSVLVAAYFILKLAAYLMLITD